MLIRYRIARHIIHFGLWLMPDSRYKREVLAMLWQHHDHVVMTVETARGL